MTTSAGNRAILADGPLGQGSGEAERLAVTHPLGRRFADAVRINPQIHLAGDDDEDVRRRLGERVDNEFAGRKILHMCSDDGGREIVRAQRLERSTGREQRREVIGHSGHRGFVRRAAVPPSWALTVGQGERPLR
jgi:hypothetical protein